MIEYHCGNVHGLSVALDVGKERFHQKESIIDDNPRLWFNKTF